MLLMFLWMALGWAVDSNVPGIDNEDLTLEAVDALLADPQRGGKLSDEDRESVLAVRADMAARPEVYEWVRAESKKGRESAKSYLEQWGDQPRLPEHLVSAICPPVLVEAVVVQSKVTYTEAFGAFTYHKLLVVRALREDANVDQAIWFRTAGTTVTGGGQAKRDSTTGFESHPDLGEQILIGLYPKPSTIPEVVMTQPNDLPVMGQSSPLYHFKKVAVGDQFYASPLNHLSVGYVTDLDAKRISYSSRSKGSPLSWDEFVDRWLNLSSERPSGYVCPADRGSSK
jgi:hypothetical protein